MLRELRIRDIAIIDDLTLTFGPGLNVITGETGAGKSIILQALGLLCGARGTNDLLRADADAAVVDGLFEGEAPDDLREAMGLESGGEILVRRQLTRSGKGRIHINGGPGTLALLSRLGEHLVHIYGQHEHATLLRAATHLDLLDHFGGLQPTRERMALAYAAFAAARRRRDELERRLAAVADKRDELEAQLAELAEAAPRTGEDAALREERELLRHAERIQAVCRDGESRLYSAPGATIDTLTRLQHQIEEVATIAPALTPVVELVESSRAQLEEAALQLRGVARRLGDDPGRLEAIEDRLVTLQRLSRKHGCAADDLPALMVAIQGDLAGVESQVSDAASADAALGICREASVSVARELSGERRRAAALLETRMAGELTALGMQGGVFRVGFDSDADATPGADGIDHIEFLLSANPGEPPRPLARVASGGELSRIMLALKALTASAGETPILIFDEVDAGIGGTVADAVARRLKLLARNRQLLCITHLAQIAAYADHHIAVEKRQEDGRTITRATTLTGATRVAEVSRMLGGSRAPAEAERYARRLIAEAERTGSIDRSQP